MFNFQRGRVEWGPTEPEMDTCFLKQQHGRHKGTKVSTESILSLLGQYTRYAVVQYFFKDSSEIPLFLTSHGNSKDDSEMCYSTTKRMLQSLEDCCKEMNPSNANDAVHRGSGDEMCVRSISEEPRGKMQNLLQSLFYVLMSSFQKDELFELHSKLRNRQEELGKGFVWEINFTDSPHAFLAQEDQLDNIERLCTSSPPFSVQGVDATFKLVGFF